MDLPRVTEILNPFSGYIGTPPDILEGAAKIGTRVHSICIGQAMGAWIGEIPEDLLGFVKSFHLWRSFEVNSFVIAEKRLVDNNLGFTGQLDLVMEDPDGKTHLVDLKTCRSQKKTHMVQLAAYRHLLALDGMQVDFCDVVYLKRSGEAAIVKTKKDLTEEFHVFTAALSCWNFFHRRPEKPKPV